MFRFAYANMNSVSCAAAANCAEATSSCAAANTNNTMMNTAMDAAFAASICIIGMIISICLISLSILSLRVLGLSILGLIIIYRAGVLGKTQA